jgi:hypothetical protein
MDRDENLAVNILTRFLARPSPHTPDECGVLQEDGLEAEVTGTSEDRLSAEITMFYYILKGRKKTLWICKKNLLLRAQ